MRITLRAMDVATGEERVYRLSYAQLQTTVPRPRDVHLENEDFNVVKLPDRFGHLVFVVDR